MIKLLRSLCLFVLLAICPSMAFGQSISDAFGSLGSYDVGGVTITPSFTPIPTDLSVNYLSSIFGTVGTVLHGTTGQMLGQLFKVFNIGILVLAGIYLIYTIFMTVLSTAHEGEFMGRKWNSAWIAVRTVLGLGLLVPSATTGYSTVQIIVMWIVIQGAGFANMAWYSALKYLGEGGQVYTPPSTDIGSMLDLVGTVMEMQVCMYKAQDVMQTQQKNLQQSQAQQTTNTNTAAPATPAQNFVQNFTPLFQIVKDTENQWHSIVRFPGNPYNNDGQQDNACGQISFGSKDSEDAVKNNQKISTLQAAVQQIILDTQSYAKQLAIPDQSPSSFENYPQQLQSALVGAAADWINITLPIRAEAHGNVSKQMKSYAEEAVQQGWIMAGRYYYAIGSINRKATEASSVKVSIDAPPAGFPKSSSYISFKSSPAGNAKDMGGNDDDEPYKRQPALQFSDNDKVNLAVLETTVGANVNSARAVANQADQAGKTVKLRMGSAGVLHILLDPIGTALYEILKSFSTSKGDPLVVLQNIGITFLTLAGTLWLAGTIAVFTLGSSSSSLASVQPVGYGVEDALFAFIPVFTAFVLVFFGLGATFAFYIPLIPYIIFVFSAVGWLISVIEAMVAAPLVALGITHPEGHDLLGKSEQAMMLVLAVFLRPVLMIIGLIAGIILSRVVLRYLNSGFFQIVFDVGDFNLFAFVSVLIIYAMLLLTIVNQSFSLIYAIPDRVMRWLGVSGEQTTGAQEALQASKGGMEQITSAQERLGSQVSSSSADVSQKALQRNREAAKQGTDKGTKATPTPPGGGG